MSVNKYRLLQPNITDITIKLPVSINFDNLGIDDSISKYEDVVINDSVNNIVDYEIVRFQHKGAIPASPTPTPTTTTTPTPTVTPTMTMTPTVTPTNQASVTPTPTNTVTPTSTVTPTASSPSLNYYGVTNLKLFKETCPTIFTILAGGSPSGGCGTWFKFNSKESACSQTFCGTNGYGCTGECVGVYVTTQRTPQTARVNDSLYTLSGGIYTKLEDGWYVNSIESVVVEIYLGVIKEITACSGSLVQDVMSNYYSTVNIGTQTWLKENLMTTSYNDGSVIPNITDTTLWKNATVGAYSYYNNTSACFGPLYNWFVATDTRGVCPTGYKIPSYQDFTTLKNYLGGANTGGEIKISGTTWWDAPNTDANNSSKFNAIPAGSRDYKGNFEKEGEKALYWQSSGGLCLPGLKSHSNVNHNNNDFNNAGCDNKNNGYSIRCVKI